MTRLKQSQILRRRRRDACQKWQFSGLNPRCLLLQAEFRILQQKYVEQVMAGDTQGALKTLRQELAPMPINPKKVKRLAGAATLLRCLMSISELPQS